MPESITATPTPLPFAAEVATDGKPRVLRTVVVNSGNEESLDHELQLQE
jgi:hypothetical protein